MADFGIKVTIDPSSAEAGLKRVKKGLTETERTAQMVQRAVKDMGGALGAVGRGGGGLTATQRQAKEASKAIAGLGALANREFKAMEGSAKNFGQALAQAGRAAGLKRNLIDASAASRKTKADLAKIPDEMEKIEKSGVSAASKIKVAFAALGIGLVLKKALAQIDTFGSLQNKLRLVTTGTADLKNITKELFGVANSTRQSFEGVATVFSRVTRATESMGLKQKEVLSFTKSLSQAVAISGATAQEARGGLLQFSQALASGTLRGEEFNSVNDQLPQILAVLRQNLGVTQGELRKMAFAGKITSKIIIDSFKKASGDLDKNFGKTIPTIGESITVLGNTVLQALGAFNEATGFTGKFVAALTFLGDNLALIGKALKFLIFLTGSLFIKAFLFKAVPAIKTFALTIRTSAIPAIHSLTAAIMANPLGLLATALALVASAALAFGEGVDDADASIQGMNESMGGFGRVLVDVYAPGLNKASDAAREHRKEMEKLAWEHEKATKIAANNKATQKKLTKIRQDHAAALDKNASAVFKETQANYDAIDAIDGSAEAIAVRTANRKADKIEAASGVKFQRGERGDLERSELALVKATKARDALTASREAAKASRAETISGLRALRASLSPMVAAEQELLDMTKLLTDAQGLNKISVQEQIRLQGLATKATADAREPVRVALEQLREESSLMLFNTEARKRDIEFRKVQADLVGKKGGSLTGAETQALRTQLDVLELIKNAKAGVLAFDKEQDKARTEREKSAWKEVDAFLKVQQSFSDRLASMHSEAAVQDLINQKRFVDAEVLRVINEYKAKGITLTLAQIEATRKAAQAQKDAGDAAAEAGKKGFDKWSKLAEVINAAAGESLTFEQRLRNVATALARIAAVQLLVGSFGANAGVASALSGLLPGFAQGGSFKVGGSGGTDSQPVAFMASPNETVTIQTPQQRAAAPAAAAPAPQVTVNLVDDVASLVDSYLGSPAAGRRITQHIDRNANAMKRRFR